jgi:hypothetical protein
MGRSFGLVIGAAATVLLAGGPAAAQYARINQPTSPRSYEECSVMEREFDQAWNEINQALLACYRQTGLNLRKTQECEDRYKPGADRLREARDRAGRDCRAKVAAYIEQKRAQEREAHERAEHARREAERQERERANQAAQQRDAARRQEEARRHQEEARRQEDARRQQAQARADAEHRARQDEMRRQIEEQVKRGQLGRETAQRQLENFLKQDNALREQARRQEEQEYRASLERRERADEPRERAREPIGRGDPPRQDGGERLPTRDTNAPPEVPTAARREAEEKTYWRLVQQLAEVTKTTREMSAFPTNPFETSTFVAGKTIDKGLAAATTHLAAPIGPRQADDVLDAVTATLDVGRGIALSSNPFAKEISGVAAAGTNQVQGEVLGALDRASRSLDTFVTDDSGAPAAATSPTSGGDGRGQPSSTYSRNPFASPDRPTTYYDRDTGRNLIIPDGHTLYRDPQTRQLRVVPTISIPRNASGDGSVCSTTGLGVVTPACEESRRTANPFASGSR